ncbi:MAG: hypothetical protein HQL54_04660 [Magnetococcales bacterium]|nr:hypothetical protein [Magnetococcales bacterium]
MRNNRRAFMTNSLNWSVLMLSLSLLSVSNGYAELEDPTAPPSEVMEAIALQEMLDAGIDPNAPSEEEVVLDDAQQEALAAQEDELAALERAEAERARKMAIKPQFWVSSTMISDIRRSALIDGQMRQEGDVLGDWTVSKIEQHEVVFSSEWGIHRVVMSGFDAGIRIGRISTSGRK